jgi:hypothetical protein
VVCRAVKDLGNVNAGQRAFVPVAKHTEVSVHGNQTGVKNVLQTMMFNWINEPKLLP